MSEPKSGLSGAALPIAGLMLALSNFMVVLDTTIANVSVGHMAGSLGISSSQGTWIITSYSVAEAICVPLTGFFSARFGTVRTFILGMVGFAVFSMLCGMSTSLAMLVVCRLGQGFCGGPIMPLTQTLLMRIFPAEKQGAAMALWAMTTVTAPILGPILGGLISDNWSWHWIFFINLPIAAICSVASLYFLRSEETPTRKTRIDTIGLMLMVLWIGALQIMLDLGREHDWFSSNLIVALAIVAVVGFGAFCIWELTDDHPAVDLRIFRYRGFLFAVTALSVTFGVFFTTAVIVPQLLQSNLNYTATYAGYATAMTGVSAVVMSPIVGRLVGKVDPRLLVFIGITWLGLASLMRVAWNGQADFWTFALPQFVQGFGMPLFFIPVTTIALGAVRPEEIASAAGLMSFLRTLSGAVGTSLLMTVWDNGNTAARSALVSVLNTGDTVAALSNSGMGPGQIARTIEQLVSQQSLMVSSLHVFLASACVFFLSALIIWLAPRPKQRGGAPTAGH